MAPLIWLCSTSTAKDEPIIAWPGMASSVAGHSQQPGRVISLSRLIRFFRP